MTKREVFKVGFFDGLLKNKSEELNTFGFVEAQEGSVSRGLYPTYLNGFDVGKRLKELM